MKMGNISSYFIKRTKAFTMAVTLLFISNILLLLFGVAAYASADQINIPTYMITTRGNDPSQPIQIQHGPGYHGNYQFGDVNELFQSCPSEIVIFVHGVGVSPGGATEQLDRVKMSLEKNGYNTTLVGYSWGSQIEWGAAKILARDEGAKLAQFIADYKDICKNNHNLNSDIQLLGHSLGSRVILSTLESLHDNPVWNNNSNNFRITSVNLMGAAVDDEEVSTDPLDISDDPTNMNTVKIAYGKAIQDEVLQFYNLFNPEDNALEPSPLLPFDMFYEHYPFFEKDSALGQSGHQTSPRITLPNNYVQVNVENEIGAISNADAIDGRDVALCNNFGFCPIVGIGDNHLGYMGFRDLGNNDKLADDGAMNVVVNHLHNG